MTLGCGYVHDTVSDYICTAIYICHHEQIIEILQEVRKVVNTGHHPETYKIQSVIHEEFLTIMLPETYFVHFLFPLIPS